MRLTVTYLDGEQLFWHFGQKGDCYTWKKKRDFLIVKRRKGSGDRTEIPLQNIRTIEVEVNL